MVVCKMAAVGCLRDNGTMEGDESSEKEGLELMKMCRKNGIHQDCFMGENARDSLDSRPTKTERSPRLNGSSKSVSAIFTKPSIPTLRSRKDKISPELGRRRRRPSKGEGLELRIRCCMQDGGRCVGLGDAAADPSPPLYMLDLGCESKAAGLRCGSGGGVGGGSGCLCHHSTTQEVCVSASPPELEPRGGVVGAPEDAVWKKERACSGSGEEVGGGGGGYDTPDSPLHCPSPPSPRACTPLPFPAPASGSEPTGHVLSSGGGSNNLSLASSSSSSSFSSSLPTCPSSLLSSIMSPSVSLSSLFGVSRSLEPQHHYHHIHYNNNNNSHHHNHQYQLHQQQLTALELTSTVIGSRDKGSSSSSSSSNTNSSTNAPAKDSSSSLPSGSASAGASRTMTTAATISSSGSGPRASNPSSAASASGGAASSEQPPAASGAAAEETAVACQWKGCGAEVGPADLLEHLRHVHVDTQSGGETFVCQWEGCKVAGKASCSMSWLERHVVAHGGHKPYKCILPHCGARFPSQAALHRHVNAHFVTQAAPAASRANRPRGEEAAARLLRKRGKLRRRRPQCVRNGDFFDSGVMDQLRQQLWDITQQTQLDLGSGSSQHLTFHSSVIARRTDETGKVSVLLHWHPEDVLDDTWVPLSQVTSLGQRVIPISQLPPLSAANLHPTIYRQHRFRKHRRK